MEMTDRLASAAYPDLWASLASAWDALFAWIETQQAELFRGFVDAIGIAAFSANLAGSLDLVVAGLIYGIFHAIGPGPGKAVLVAYLVSHPATPRRAVSLGLAAALAQGLFTAVLILGRSAITPWFDSRIGHAVGLAENASAVAVALVGAVLLAKAARRLHRLLFAPETPPPKPINLLWFAAAIGLRPDLVGVVVLLSTHGLGATWIGLVGVAAMAAGTACGVALLCGTLAVTRSALAWISRVAGRWARIGGAGVSVAGAFGIVFIGLILLDSELTARTTALITQ